MTIFVISDLHLKQDSVLTFFKDDEKKIPLRDFKNMDEMHGYIVRRWNEVVNVNDKVYILGDITWGEEGLLYLNAMKGRKILVKGNHDNVFNCRKYLSYFDDIHGVKPLTHNGVSMVLTHVPVHPSCLERWDINVHGHLHSNTIDDERYFNVSVEQVDYTPLSLDQIAAWHKERSALTGVA